MNISTRFFVLALLVWAGFAALPASVLAQSVRPAEMEVQYHRALIAWESGNSLFEAKARIDRVLTAQPDDVEARMLRASILMDLGRPEEAIDDALFAVQLQPANGEAQLILCETALANSNPSMAKRALAEASDLIVDNIQSLARLSMCALSLEDTARAESLARIAVALDESDPRGAIQLARVFVRTERTQAAVTLLDNLVSKSLLTESAILNDAEFAPVFRPRKN
jgi:cytochrome c-type biogenesis protein CcmH/NrfG